MVRLDAGILEGLRGYDSATIFNAVAKIQGVAGENYTGPELGYLNTEFGAFIGYAVTSEVTPLDPEPSPLPWDAYYDLLNDTPGPIVAVMKDVDKRQYRAAIFGDGMARLHRALGVVGAVADGCVRDLMGISDAGLPIFATGTVPGHGPFYVRRIGEPVVVGQITVKTGDLLFADTDGIVNIPIELAIDTLRVAEEIRQFEKRIFDAYTARNFDWNRYKNSRNK